MDFKGQYLTYDEYKALGGNLDLTPFNLLEFEARRKIDLKTQQRLKNVEVIPPEVKLCTYKLVNVMSNYTDEVETTTVKKGNVISETIDGYSISYATGSQIQEMIATKEKEINETINTYLMNTVVNNIHLLYLGVS